MPSEMIAKTIFGIQTEISGGVDPASAKVRNNVKNRMKMNERRKPTAICNPVPPRLFRDETITPINTRMRIVNGDE